MQHLHSLTDTPTLRDDTPNTSHKSGRSKSRKCPADDGIGNEGTTNPPPLAVINSNSYAPQAKPRHSLLTRTESLDTMSSCESIASDDMMMDFDSSVDSIDRYDLHTNIIRMAITDPIDLWLQHVSVCAQWQHVRPTFHGRGATVVRMGDARRQRYDA